MYIFKRDFELDKLRVFLYLQYYGELIFKENYII